MYIAINRQLESHNRIFADRGQNYLDTRSSKWRLVENMQYLCSDFPYLFGKLKCHYSQ